MHSDRWGIKSHIFDLIKNMLGNVLHMITLLCKYFQCNENTANCCVLFSNLLSLHFNRLMLPIKWQHCLEAARRAGKVYAVIAVYVKNHSLNSICNILM